MLLTPGSREQYYRSSGSDGRALPDRPVKLTFAFHSLRFTQLTPQDESSKMSALLITLSGPSGAGKSTLLAILRSHPLTYSTHVQGTNRLPRTGDDPDVLCLSAVSQVRYAFMYRSAGYDYGIEVAQIDDALSQGLHHIVVCNDIDTIAKIKLRYGTGMLCAFLDCDLDETQWWRLQHDRGLVTIDIQRRWDEAETLRELSRSQPALFDGRILNSFAVTPMAMLRQFEELVSTV